MPFKPGQSGNPAGRPKENTHVRDLARAHTAEAIRTLAGIMKNGDKDAARVAAAEALLSRGWGKPEQAMTVLGAEGGPLEIIVTHAHD